MFKSLFQGKQHYFDTYLGMFIRVKRLMPPRLRKFPNCILKTALTQKMKKSDTSRLDLVFYKDGRNRYQYYVISSQPRRDAGGYSAFLRKSTQCYRLPKSRSGWCNTLYHSPLAKKV